jgi:hypothetical protein
LKLSNSVTTNDPARHAAPLSEPRPGRTLLKGEGEPAKRPQTSIPPSCTANSPSQAAFGEKSTREGFNWRLTFALAVNFAAWALIGYVALRLLGH